MSLLFSDSASTASNGNIFPVFVHLRNDGGHSAVGHCTCSKTAHELGVYKKGERDAGMQLQMR